MAVTIKQISVLQSNGSYLTKDIGVDAQNVDIDETYTLADKATDWDNKVDKVSGKGLSTEDYTTEDKEKLAGLTNYDDSALTGRISELEGVIPGSASAENKLATMADIPTGSSGGSGVGTSDYLVLDNKPQIAGITLSGNRTLADLGIQPVEEGKGLSTNDFSNEEKTKLAGLTNYDDTALDNRISSVEHALPDKVDKDGNKGLSTNDFSNVYKDKLDSLSNYDDTVLTGKIADIEELIPTTANESNKLATMADIPSPSTSGGGTTNYNDLENKPSIAGVALSGNKTLADLGIQQAEEGKGLSVENYTTEEKTKLSSLSNYDDTALAGRITSIENIIPTTASEDNKLATMADISSGSGDAVDYKNLLTLINYDFDQSPYNIELGETYTLGSEAKTNTNNSIQVKCLSVDNETAIMQTYGVTAGPWPGEGDLTESYENYWGELSSAISGVKLPTGTNANNIEPSGAYDVLKTAASNHSSFGIADDGAWFGTPRDSDYAYLAYSYGVVYDSTGRSFVCAPYFTLNLSKVLINDGVIELNPSYKDAEFADLVTKIERKLNNRYTKSEVDTALNDKVDKISGKGLSTEDYTTEEKTKLAGLSNYDDTILAGKVADIEGVVPDNASEDNKLVTVADLAEYNTNNNNRFIGTHEEWETLTEEEQALYTDVIFTDDNGESGGSSTSSAQNINDFLKIIAPPFSELVNYSVGDLCIYEGELCKCVIDHPTGEWDDTHFGVTNLANEIYISGNEEIPNGDDLRY